MPARNTWMKHLLFASVLAASSAWAVGARATVAITGLNILPTFDSSITNDPNATAIESTIYSAIQVYRQDFSNTLNVPPPFLAYRPVAVALP